MMGYIMFWIGFVVMTWLITNLVREIEIDMQYDKFVKRWLEREIYTICDEVEALATVEW